MHMQIRRIAKDEDFEALTDLLHRAYAELAGMGYRYLATHQSPDITRDRCESGECLIATLDSKVVGTATFYTAAQTGSAEWYDRLEVASFGQFAVEPSLQRSGIGGQLMHAIEELAKATGAEEIACDTAEGATHLIDMYTRRGYRLVGKVDWGETNYESVILSKNLRGGT